MEIELIKQLKEINSNLAEKDKTLNELNNQKAKISREIKNTETQREKLEYYQHRILHLFINHTLTKEELEQEVSSVKERIESDEELTELEKCELSYGHWLIKKQEREQGVFGVKRT